MLIHSPLPVHLDRVVILGGGGFVGRLLTQRLREQGVPVLAPGRQELDLAAPDAGRLLADRLQPRDSLVLLAALTPDKGRGVPPFMANLRMGAAVASALETVPSAHLVYVSSDAVYPFADSPVDEATAAEPGDLYAAMHLSRELMLKPLDTPLAILRPTLIYGAADTHNSYGPNRLRRVARADGRITLFGDGEERRDHILVDDVVELILRTLAARSTGLLNLATGQSVSYHDLANRVAACFTRPVDIICTPRKTPATHRHFDISALRRAFPDFRFTPLDQGLAKVHADMMEGE
ncbi:MAG: NAD(P)-dependent oxidoreductase [Azospirillaceae bacterium]|nr:NAD(P)-dependent oxidoreductase [Azospirillaceae bacterium]